MSAGINVRAKDQSGLRLIEINNKLVNHTSEGTSVFKANVYFLNKGFDLN